MNEPGKKGEAAPDHDAENHDVFAGEAVTHPADQRRSKHIGEEKSAGQDADFGVTHQKFFFHVRLHGKEHIAVNVIENVQSGKHRQQEAGIEFWRHGLEGLYLPGTLGTGRDHQAFLAAVKGKKSGLRSYIRRFFSGCFNANMQPTLTITLSGRHTMFHRKLLWAILLFAGILGLSVYSPSQQAASAPSQATPASGSPAGAQPQAQTPSVQPETQLSVECVIDDKHECTTDASVTLGHHIKLR